jgi:hypothetical protein
VVLGEKIAGPPPPAPLSRIFLFSIVGFGVFVALMLILLHWWFRRGDEKVRAEVSRIQGYQAIEALESNAEDGLDKPLPDGHGDNGSVFGNGQGDKRTPG